MRALHEFTNVSGSSADLDASDRNYSVFLPPPVAARLPRRLLLLLPFSTSTAGLVCVVCMSWRGVPGRPECLIYSPPSNPGICGIRMFWGGDFAVA